MESSELLRTAALSSVVAFGTLSKTAIEEHRVWTHGSIDFINPSHEKFARIGGAHLADTKAWASVHRVHHSTPDVNLLPFVEIADYLEWHNSQTLKQDGQVDIPEHIVGLDPAVGAIDTELVREIGEISRDLVSGMYQKKQSYSFEEAQKIMHETNPRYFYEDQETMKRDRQNPVMYDPDNLPSLHQIRFLLRDPHSPALHKMGILGVLRCNVPLYAYAERNFSDPAFRQPYLKPDDLDDALRTHSGKLRLAYVGAMALASMAINRESSSHKLTKATLGAAASGTVVLKLIAGGNITNALGHGGDLQKLSVTDLLDGVVYPKSDGTYTSNYKLLAPPTLDEVGGQYEHHEDPTLIAYSNDTGIKRWLCAPFGRTLEALVSKDIVFKKGDKFDGLDSRPDMPSEAVLKIEEVRRKYYAAQEASKSDPD